MRKGCLFCLLVLCCLFAIPIRFVSIADFNKLQQAQVQVQIGEKPPITLEVEMYSTIAEVLSHVEIDETIDLSRLNLNQPVHDQDVIVLPKKSQQTKISLNSATKEELMQLPGVGEKTAELILEYRQTKTFQSLEDVMNVKGIGQAKYEKMLPYLSL